MPTKLKASTVDVICEKNNIRAPDFIKIDTQGSEIDILKGAKGAVTNASLIYTECPILEYNVGAPTLLDYVSYMRSEGFLPHDLFEIHSMKGVLVQIDILFMRKELIFDLFPGSSEFYKNF